MPSSNARSVVASHTPSLAALCILLVLQLTMLGALYTQTVPHPPLAIALFGLGPFIGASLSVCVAGLVFQGVASRTGAWLCLLAALLALLSFGPHKWLDPSIALIWPSVLVGEIAAAILVVQAIRRLRPGTQAPVGA